MTPKSAGVQTRGPEAGARTGEPTAGLWVSGQAERGAGWSRLQEHMQSRSQGFCGRTGIDPNTSGCRGAPAQQALPEGPFLPRSSLNGSRLQEVFAFSRRRFRRELRLGASPARPLYLTGGGSRAQDSPDLSEVTCRVSRRLGLKPFHAFGK